MNGTSAGVVSTAGTAPSLFVLAVLVAAGSAVAAPAVEDRSAMPPPERVYVEQRAAAADVLPPTRDAAVDADNGDEGSLGQLYYELQVLQQEVLELRGIIEEQSHRLERMAREQRQRYLDVDRRLTALAGGTLPPASATDSTQPPDGEASLAGEADGVSEQQAYDRAFALTRQRDFVSAIAAFEQLLADYPAGTYTPNAYYWLGELYLALDEPQLEKSRQAFAQVVNVFPQHPKAPDAMYKLGVVYDRLGDPERARQYLDQVRREYPTSAAARLAATYAEQL